MAPERTLRRATALLLLAVLSATAGCNTVARDELGRATGASVRRFERSVSSFVDSVVDRSVRDVFALRDHAGHIASDARRRTATTTRNATGAVRTARSLAATWPGELEQDTRQLFADGRSRLQSISRPLELRAIADERQRMIPNTRRMLRSLPDTLRIDRTPMATPQDNRRAIEVEPTTPPSTWIERILWRIHP